MRIGLQTWGSEGDVRPFLALSGRLARMGHEVSLAITTDLPHDYRAIGEAQRVRVEVFETRPDASAEEIDALWSSIILAGNPIRQARMIMGAGFDPFIDSMFATARHLCAEHELVVGHFFVHPLQAAAELAGIPHVTVNIVHNCLPSRHIQPPGLPALGAWLRPLGWSLVRAMLNRLFLGRVNALRTRVGLPRAGDLMEEVWASKALNLVAVSPTVCRRPDDWGPRHQVTGFLTRPSGGAPVEPQLAAFLDAGAPPLYMTFGSMMASLTRDRMIENAVLWRETARLLGRRAVLQVPLDDAPEVVDGDDVLVVRRSEYLDVFPRCAAVVHHGGAGTTQSTLLAGVPSVVVAHMADQLFWGSELERLGVAGKTRQRRSLTPSALAQSLDSVLRDSGARRRAEELRAKVEAEEPGADVAARAILGLVR